MDFRREKDMSLLSSLFCLHDWNVESECRLTGPTSYKLKCSKCGKTKFKFVRDM